MEYSGEVEYSTILPVRQPNVKANLWNIPLRSKANWWWLFCGIFQFGGVEITRKLLGNWAKMWNIPGRRNRGEHTIFLPGCFVEYSGIFHQRYGLCIPPTPTPRGGCAIWNRVLADLWNIPKSGRSCMEMCLFNPVARQAVYNFVIYNILQTKIYMCFHISSIQ